MYDHRAIEAKWQKKWLDAGVFRVANGGGKKQYVLDMFPYPSGEGLHVGHPEGYTASDIYARYLRMNGYAVLHPMGWDAFGLPAENYAIKQGVHPSVITQQNITNFKRQIRSIGFSYDWDREVDTTDPAYYTWTQWIFLQLYNRGLAYEKEMAIWWCPKDKTGLANEEVVNGKCDRCGTTVEKKMLKQWMLKITAYADRLLEGLNDVDWPEGIKALQRNWIGKSEGAEVKFEVIGKRYVFLHGYSSGSDKHWFPWIKSELERRGAEVIIPDLPNPEDPIVADQVEAVLKSVQFDENTILVGHSLGGVVALKVLERLKKPVQQLVLVASYLKNDFLNNEPFEEKTFDWEFDFKKIKNNFRNLSILRDTSDEIVPAWQAEELQKVLGGTIIDFSATSPHAWGEKEPSILGHCARQVAVFTTRPDTLFGATYLVLSPEHELVDQITTDEQRAAVMAYTKEVANKSDLERTSLEKEKTGVFTGAYAINPVNNEKIPVWIADYVLSSYGTGAIMAVPAHDERDFAFATKFGLPVRYVVAPYFLDASEQSKPHPEFVTEERPTAVGIVKHWKEEKYLLLNWKNGWKSFIAGGIDDGENAEQAILREVQEETGYQNMRVIHALGGPIIGDFFNPQKQKNYRDSAHGIYIELLDDQQHVIAEKELAKHFPEWVSATEVLEYIRSSDAAGDTRYSQVLWQRHVTGNVCFAGEGMSLNSPGFNGLHTPETRQKIVTSLQSKGLAQIKTQYKLRDWVFSRQRYWGEPIPLVHCEKCGVVPVPEDQLPLKLPQVEKYEPTGTGESPLAGISEWVNVTCPKCGGAAKRETNTMPQWAGSCWYYLRYCDPKNEKEFASPEAMKAWLPVDMYVGGAEHAVLHLLYSRFWHKVLFDAGHIPAELGDEPFLKLKNQGLILGPDGEKMSKSRGNVINPDEIIAEFGADTLRMYEMFMGPFEDAKPWNTNGMVGVRRFLEKVQRAAERLTDEKPNIRWHKYVQSITNGIEEFRLNTCVSDLMKWTNDFGNESVAKEEFAVFLKALSPFAPHLAEELWSQMGKVTLLAQESWPSFDPKKVISESVTIAVQVMGKLRATLTMPTGSTQEDVVQAAKADTNVQKYLIGEPKKVIYVQDKLINFVV